MILETGVIIDKAFNPMYWHEPYNATNVSLPDSTGFYDELWRRRDTMLGVAHTHPWKGKPAPSGEDLTTFDPIELAFGHRYLWPIITEDQAVIIAYDEDKRDYAEVPVARFCYTEQDADNFLKTIEELRYRSFDK